MSGIPEPKRGLVVNFGYLWRREQNLGQENARKARPCAIVLADYRQSDGRRIVAVVALTHQPPRDGDESAVKVPMRVKLHLGLDDQPSWIITTEFNEFEWPGHDLEPNASGEFAYGFIPPTLYRQVRLRLLENLKAGRLNRVRR